VIAPLTRARHGLGPLPIAMSRAAKLSVFIRLRRRPDIIERRQEWQSIAPGRQRNLTQKQE
jgi:hypothetical protein